MFKKRKINNLAQHSSMASGKAKHTRVKKSWTRRFEGFEDWTNASQGSSLGGSSSYPRPAPTPKSESSGNLKSVTACSYEEDIDVFLENLLASPPMPSLKHEGMAVVLTQAPSIKLKESLLPSPNLCGQSSIDYESDEDEPIGSLVNEETEYLDPTERDSNTSMTLFSQDSFSLELDAPHTPQEATVEVSSRPSIQIHRADLSPLSAASQKIEEGRSACSVLHTDQQSQVILTSERDDGQVAQDVEAAISQELSSYNTASESPSVANRLVNILKENQGVVGSASHEYADKAYKSDTKYVSGGLAARLDKIIKREQSDAVVCQHLVAEGDTNIPNLVLKFEPQVDSNYLPRSLPATLVQANCPPAKCDLGTGDPAYLISNRLDRTKLDSHNTVTVYWPWRLVTIEGRNAIFTPSYVLLS